MIYEKRKDKNSKEKSLTTLAIIVPTSNDLKDSTKDLIDVLYAGRSSYRIVWAEKPRVTQKKQQIKKQGYRLLKNNKNYCTV